MERKRIDSLFINTFISLTKRGTKTEGPSEKKTPNPNIPVLL